LFGVAGLVNHRSGLTSNPTQYTIQLNIHQIPPYTPTPPCTHTKRERDGIVFIARNVCTVSPLWVFGLYFTTQKGKSDEATVRAHGSPRSASRLGCIRLSDLGCRR